MLKLIIGGGGPGNTRRSLKFCTVDMTVTLLISQSRNKSQKAGTDVFIGAPVVIPKEEIVQISITVTCINRDTGQE